MTSRIFGLVVGAIVIAGVTGCATSSSTEDAVSATSSGPSAEASADKTTGDSGGKGSAAAGGSGQDPSVAQQGGGKGSVNDVVPTRTQETLAPVSRDQKAPYGTGVALRVTGTRPVSIKGQGPGEMSGDGYAVTVKITNGTGKAVDLNQVVVAATYGPEATPAELTIRTPTKALRGSLGAGESAVGTYAFIVPTPLDQVQLTAGYSTDAPVVAVDL